jgi:hypothetical protein
MLKLYLYYALFHLSSQSLAQPLSPLPLRLLTSSKRPQDCHHLLQRRQPLLQLRRDLALITAQLGVKVLAVRRCAHGGAEDGLDDERVVRLEGVAVGIAEGVGELFGGVVEVVAETLGGEVEAAAGVFC